MKVRACVQAAQGRWKRLRTRARKHGYGPVGGVVRGR